MSTLLEAWELYSSTILSTASRRSIISETGRWNNYVAPTLGEKLLDEITPLELVKLRGKLLKKDLSPQTVYHCLSLLRRVMHRAKKWGLFSGEVPVFEMPQFDNKRVRFLSPVETAQLLSHLKFSNPLWHDLAVIALHTGLRAGEIFKLTTCDVQLEEGRLVVLDTKTKSNRTVPLNQHSADTFARHLNPDFPSSPIFQQNSCKAFSRAVEAVGLNKGVSDRRHRVVFHTLRHTFASRLVQAGVPLALVSQLLGHKDIKMTMRYSHLSPDQAQDAVNYLDTIDVEVCQAENPKYSQTPPKSFWSPPKKSNNDQISPNIADVIVSPSSLAVIDHF